MKKEMSKMTMTMLCVVLFAPLKVGAQDKVKISAGADAVSTYYWRGTKLGGFSIQPSLTASIGNFSLNAWGSVGIEKEDTKELDFTATYTLDKLHFGITDYSFEPYQSNARYFDYSTRSERSTHVFEANIGYDFGVFNINWFTNFAGKDYYKKSSEKRAYSTYIEASVPFTVGDVNMSTELGLTPWDGAYTISTDKFAVVNIGLTAKKVFHIKDSFDLPAFVKLAANPEASKAYIIFGLNF